MARTVHHTAWWVVALWLYGFATLRPRSGEALDAPITASQLIAFLVVLGLFTGLGKWATRIAVRKGRHYIGWSWYGLFLPYIALPHALLLKSDASPPADGDAWEKLNRAITDRSLYSAGLRDFRRYRRAAMDRGVSVPPALVDNIERLISQRESRRQLLWTIISAAAAVVTVIGGTAMWLRSDDLGTRLRRECLSILQEGTAKRDSPEMQELWIRQCVDRRGLNAR